VRALIPELTEDHLVAAIEESVGGLPRKLVTGIGDDAAVWKTPRSHLSVITTDMLVDGVHFRHASMGAGALGHKALAVNLSDIAAMGAAPVVAVVALGIVESVDENWARAFYKGMAKLARAHGCAIAGGDIVRASELTIAVTIVGEVRRSGLRLRSGAKPGDVACVTGPLGLAAAGLYLSQAIPATPRHGNGQLRPEHTVMLAAAYETPLPRVREGKFLGASRAVHAMMDLSDGLSLDGARMARASGVDLCIDLDRLFPHAALSGFLASATGQPRREKTEQALSALELMLHGGDDYELLVALEPRAFPHLAKRFRARFGRELAMVGKFERGEGKVWTVAGGSRAAHVPRGYDHLAGRSG
jgi:thiamine-monophosphate kinase